MTPGALQTKIKNHFTNAFVLKLDPTGSSLVYSTFLGGNGTGRGNAIAVDPGGHAYVAGQTTSSDFPVTPGAFQTKFGDQSQGSGFATKLNQTGSAVVYSTYLGQAEDLYDVGATGIALDSQGNAYITGEADGNFETTPGAYNFYSDGIFPPNIFLLKLNAAGKAIYSSVFGGSDLDIPNAIAVDQSGAAYVTGEASSLDFPTVNPAQASLSSGGFLTSQDGGLQWSALDQGLAQGTETVFDVGLFAPDLTAMALDPQSPSTVYLGAFSFGNSFVVRSTDSGHTFSAVHLPSLVNAIVVDPASSNIAYAGVGEGSPAFGGVYETTDGGLSWTISGLSFTDQTRVLSLAFASGSTPALYAGTTNGLYSSVDGAKTWRRVDSGLPDATFNTLAINPVSSSIIYAGTGDGIIKSQDGGAHWQS
ncbi:MAG: SBBP repeat-containing protein, partial [Blastocatellia bacterium]